MTVCVRRKCIHLLASTLHCFLPLPTAGVRERPGLCGYCWNINFFWKEEEEEEEATVWWQVVCDTRVPSGGSLMNCGFITQPRRRCSTEACRCFGSIRRQQSCSTRLIRMESCYMKRTAEGHIRPSQSATNASRSLKS